MPFGQLLEILDLDNGLGPHLPAFDITPNFGLGVVIDGYPPMAFDTYTLDHGSGLLANCMVSGVNATNVHSVGNELINWASFGTNLTGHNSFHKKTFCNINLYPDSYNFFSDGFIENTMNLVGIGLEQPLNSADLGNVGIGITAGISINEPIFDTYPASV